MDLLLATAGVGAFAQLRCGGGIGQGERVQSQAEAILKEAGAFSEGHFLLTSGLHSLIYWEKFRILEQPHSTERMCRMIVDHFRGYDCRLVVGPTTGGVIVAYEVARQLGVRSIFAEREGTGRVFRRGFRVFPGERVLVVDDVLTTGGSVRDVLAEVKRLGGAPGGRGGRLDRTQGHLE